MVPALLAILRGMGARGGGAGIGRALGGLSGRGGAGIGRALGGTGGGPPITMNFTGGGGVGGGPTPPPVPPNVRDRTHEEAESPAGDPVKKFSDLGFQLQGIQAVGSSIKEMGAQALQAVNPLHKVSRGITQAADAFSTGLDTLLEPLHAGVGAVGKMRDSITALGGSVAEFTKYSNPAYVKQFEFAFRDLSGTIGHTLLPVQQFGTQLTRSFADVFHKLSPSIEKTLSKLLGPLTAALPRLVDAAAPLLRTGEKFIDMIGEMIGVFTDMEGESFFEELQSAFEVFEAVASPVVTTVGELARAIAQLASAASHAVADFLREIGLIAKPLTREKLSDKSVGAGVRDVSLGGVNSVLEKAWANAFMSALGPTKKPEERVPGLLEQILAKMDPQKLWDYFVSEVLPNAAASLAKAIRDNVPGGNTIVAAASGDFAGAAKAAGAGPDTLSLIAAAEAKASTVGNAANRRAKAAADSGNPLDLFKNDSGGFDFMP